ncbi:MAG TPA: SprT family zinc-dependent metalloprotease, partial [Magnetospirillaceae bacterium]|nr:SprT family zinc-dependent metalloprotease [Magnetospirillaceae bacterium]
MANSILHDKEFGSVTIRRSALSRHIKLKIDQRGGIVVSMPARSPLFLARSLLAQSRPQIRKHLNQAATSQASLLHGDIIGKTHRLILTPGETFTSRLQGTELHVTIPANVEPTESHAQYFIKQAALKALRAQAKAYLSRRLDALGRHGEFNFSAVRFSNAGTRWGSCSSTGTISLNIWLMQLPFELIDYVLIHELCHTRHMNHSPLFWEAVEQFV